MATLPSCKRGDTLVIPFQWRESDEPGAAPIDLTGCTARLQVRTKDGVLKISITSDDAIAIDELAGDVTATLSAELMRGLSKATYLTDLELTFPDGTVQSTETISIPVVEDQTKPAEV